MALADHDQEHSDHSSGQTQRVRKSSDSLSFTTNLPQKRGQHEVVDREQGCKDRKMTVEKALQQANWSCEGQQSKLCP